MTMLPTLAAARLLAGGSLRSRPVARGCRPAVAVAESTLQRSPSPTGAAPDRAATAPDGTARRLIGAYPAAIAAVCLVAVSTLLVLWAGTRPGFDPYGWLVWGHQTIIGSLDTNAAPSWKPLSFIFTAPYALAGHRLELRLWMITAVAMSLAGSVLAGRIAYRLTVDAGARR